ncbi:hypothetical protein QP028_04925 [Corynebacterium suedekumii]|nr:hypothetical protein QP028_04925 [Corynebacterium suedekumii]
MAARFCRHDHPRPHDRRLRSGRLHQRHPADHRPHLLPGGPRFRPGSRRRHRRYRHHPRLPGVPAASLSRTTSASRFWIMAALFALCFFMFIFLVPSNPEASDPAAAEAAAAAAEAPKKDVKITEAWSNRNALVLAVTLLLNNLVGVALLNWSNVMYVETLQPVDHRPDRRRGRLRHHPAGGHLDRRRRDQEVLLRS